MWEAPCWDLWCWMCVWRRRWGVPWEGSYLSCWCSWGSLWPEPPKDLQICDQVGSQPVPSPPVHNCPQGDLYPQVQPAQAGAQASPDQMVPWPYPSCSRGVLWWRKCLGCSSWREKKILESSLNYLYIVYLFIYFW